MPLAECKLNDWDANLSRNQYTSSLYLCQGRGLRITKQERHVAWHVAMFSSPQERKSFQKVGLAVTGKHNPPPPAFLLINYEDISKSMVKAEIIAHVFHFSGLFLLMLSDLCDQRSPSCPLLNFTQSPCLSCLPWRTTLFALNKFMQWKECGLWDSIWIRTLTLILTRYSTLGKLLNSLERVSTSTLNSLLCHISSLLTDLVER